jgi:hypothetical protein
MPGSASSADATLVGAPMVSTYSGPSAACARAIRSVAAGLGTGRSGAGNQAVDPRWTGVDRCRGSRSSSRCSSSWLWRMPPSGPPARSFSKGAA